jgi:hypothetical protein
MPEALWHPIRPPCFAQVLGLIVWGQQFFGLIYFGYLNLSVSSQGTVWLNFSAEVH